MPLIQVTLLEGRTPEQKRNLVQALTNAAVEQLGTKPEAVVITMVDVPPSNYAMAGVLMLDRTKAKT
jgi:4-oxalocrotonate tautomerase